MIPAGYMAKKIAVRPDWLKADAVADLYSVSGCSSKNFIPYYGHRWKHNSFWFFNTRDELARFARDRAINLIGTTLFYYEVFEQEFDEIEKEWERIELDPNFQTDVEKPKAAHLIGFDVVSCSCGMSPECSPLSCNSLAEDIPVNRYCLMERFEDAIAALESGSFDNCEPGPFRIFAVYSVET